MLITYTGRLIDPLAPRVEDISIMDIAHALANTCRYNGHCREFYSVAQHSVLLSYIAPAPLWALLHDAAEAYIGDIIRPIKALPQLAALAEIESMLLVTIAARFGLPVTMPPEVAAGDDALLVAEMKALRLYKPEFLPGVAPALIPPYAGTITPGWSPAEAESNFMCRFDEVYCGN